METSLLAVQGKANRKLEQELGQSLTASSGQLAENVVSVVSGPLSVVKEALSTEHGA